MEFDILANLIFLCLVNGFFTFAGIFLNSVVIISLWNSPLLRRGACHFMILVLSCFDLAVIIVAHPTIILLSIAWTFEENTVFHVGEILEEIYIILQLLEFGVVLTLNVDRYLAIAYPFFYRARVTKGRIITFMIFTQLISLFVPILRRISYKKVVYLLIAIIIPLVLCLIFFMNYKMFMIARNKRQATHSSIISQRNTIYTCLWIIACFSICTIPSIVYSTLKFAASTSTENENVWMIFRFWMSTMTAMNCTFNCVILFWSNRILRRKVNKQTYIV
jgi:hypothetical protein